MHPLPTWTATMTSTLATTALIWDLPPASVFTAERAKPVTATKPPKQDPTALQRPKAVSSWSTWISYLVGGWVSGWVRNGFAE